MSAHVSSKLCSESQVRYESLKETFNKALIKNRKDPEKGIEEIVEKVGQEIFQLELAFGDDPQKLNEARLRLYIKFETDSETREKEKKLSKKISKEKVQVSNQINTARPFNAIRLALLEDILLTPQLLVPIQEFYEKKRDAAFKGGAGGIAGSVALGAATFGVGFVIGAPIAGGVAKAKHNKANRALKIINTLREQHRIQMEKQSESSASKTSRATKKGAIFTGKVLLFTGYVALRVLAAVAEGMADAD